MRKIKLYFLLTSSVSSSVPLILTADCLSAKYNNFRNVNDLYRVKSQSGKLTEEKLQETAEIKGSEKEE